MGGLFQSSKSSLLLKQPAPDLTNMAQHISRDWEKDGKICWGIFLDKAALFALLGVRPNFLLEYMEKAINLEYVNPNRAHTAAGILMVKNKYLYHGWRVAHFVFYLGYDVIRNLLEEGLIVPLKDDKGRQLSHLFEWYERDFHVASFKYFNQNAFARLKLLECNEEQKRKFVLFCWKGEQSSEQPLNKKRCVVQRSSSVLLPETLKLISEFLFTNNTIKGKIEVEVWR